MSAQKSGRKTFNKIKPMLIRSDNGSNLVGAQKELCDAIHDWNYTKLGEFLRQREITWKFNPPYGSHMGEI